MTLAIAFSLGLFARRSSELLGYLKLGQADDRAPRSWIRKIKDQIVVVLGQRKLLQWTIPGIMHALIFWGFIVLLTTIVEAFGGIYFDRFHIPLIGTWGPLGALQGLFIAAVLAGIGTAFVIRKLQRPGRFQGPQLDEADYILVAIPAIMGTILAAR